jgi:hypothetical protein
MKNFAALPLVILGLFASASASAASKVDSALVAKLNAHIGNCNAPGMEPKPKMKELADYIQSHGFKDAKIECGISNLDPKSPAPVLLLHLADGGEIYVNYKKSKGGARVSEIVEDRKTDAGPKRETIWPAAKKKAK